MKKDMWNRYIMKGDMKSRNIMKKGYVKTKYDEIWWNITKYNERNIEK